MPNPVTHTFTPSQLDAGDFPIVMDSGVIAASQLLQRGAVLGQVTASGEYLLCKAAASIARFIALYNGPSTLSHGVFRARFR